MKPAKPRPKRKRFWLFDLFRKKPPPRLSKAQRRALVRQGLGEGREKGRALPS
jgi:hypothetical protein